MRYKKKVGGWISRKGEEEWGRRREEEAERRGEGEKRGGKSSIQM